MNIGHIALYASDLEKVRAFYEKYFKAESNQKYVNQKGFSSYFLTFDSGARLEIMAHRDLEEMERKEYGSGYHHLAFCVGSKEEVIKLTEQIVADGYALLSAPRMTGDGYFESCISDPEGNRVEITV